MKQIALLIFLAQVLFASMACYADDPCQFYGNDDPSDAITECTNQIQSGERVGDDLAYLYDTRAKAWMKKGNYDNALTDTNEALRINPERIESLLHRGYALQELKLYENAERDYTKVIELGQANLDAYTMRGSLYGLTGKFDKAIADSSLALRANSSYFPEYNSVEKDVYKARALFNRGLAWKLTGEYKKAIADYETAIEYNPGNPQAWVQRSPDWNNKSLSEQADILYKDISFSPDINTSDSRIFSIQKITKTRYGSALLIRTSTLPASTIMFNGKIVYEDPAMYVGIWGYFQQGNSDVILVSSNPGGSATPDTYLSFLVIDSETKTQLISSSSFVADSPVEDSIKTRTDKAGRIFVNLGFSAGKEVIAELESGKLVIHTYAKKNAALNQEYCEWLYDKGEESCSSEVARQQGCVSYARDAGIYDSISDMLQLKYISDMPGYSQSGLNKSCLAWCNNKNVSYKAFSKATCNIK